MARPLRALNAVVKSGLHARDTNQLGYTRSCTYNAIGDLTRRTDRNGRVMQYVSDGLDRVTEERWLENATSAPKHQHFQHHGRGAANEVQQVGFTVSMITGGTFTLTFNRSTTSALAWNATAGEVQSALEALPTIGAGSLSVTKLQNQVYAQE